MPTTPDPVANLAADLAAVSICKQSRQPQVSITFGDFAGMVLPDGPHITLQNLAGAIEANRLRADEGLNETREAISEQLQEQKEVTLAIQQLTNKIYGFQGDMAALLQANPGLKIFGPEAPEAIDHVLRDRPAREVALKTYTLEWLTQTRDKGLWPRSALEDIDFMVKYIDLMKAPGSGMPSTPQSALPGSVALPAPSPIASASKAVSAPLVPTSSMPSSSLPFASAMAGRHIKFELPRPSKFARIDADSNIRAWLLRVHEYVTISGIDPSAWVVVASHFLDRDPLALWEARKTQLAEQPGVLYAWDSFREWCISSFTVINHEKRALDKLQALRQTGSVTAYKAAHDVLASQTTLPMQLRLLWWEHGLKPEIAAQVKVDPLTYKEFTDIDKAMSAACALDSHIDASSSVAAKRKQSSPSLACATPARAPPAQRQRFERILSAGKSQTARWTGDSAEEFTLVDTEGALAEPLPAFFSKWIGDRNQGSSGKPLLPHGLMYNGSPQDGIPCCFYKGCRKVGHRWTQCPDLALHVAKNPKVRDG